MLVSPHTDLGSLWRIALGDIELSVSKAHFATWFKQASLARREEDLVVVAVSNIFTREWLENKYHQVILASLQRVDPTIQRIRYEVSAHGAVLQRRALPLGETILYKRASTTPPTPNSAEPPRESESQWDKASNLNVRYTFETFVVGAHNELAHACAQAVARRPGEAYNPLFLYGGVGLGKTHLLQAVGNAVLGKSSLRIRYVTSEKFMHELITAIQTKTQYNFRDRYRAVDILIVDDVQFLAGKEKTQDELFHTFNELYGAGKQLVFSSDRPPKAIATLEERLRSRFEGGMIADIGAPDLETRIAILNAKCTIRKAHVPESVLTYIAAQVANNIRELEGCLNRVLAYFELQGTVPDLERTKELLSNLFSQPKRTRVHTDLVLEAVRSHYHLDLSDLVGKSRRKQVVLPRQVAMYLLRSENQFSFPAIGAIFGGRDHTTAMHACGKVGEHLERNEVLRQDVVAIRQKLYISAE
ncbi:MAG: chromosomal replication initiator protein [Parcubacteria group bacterium Gr01-1014_38]|nr:MAG: chromosomal replication initiator protein [Parcubacteria group bacterium Gr01-1014_38]